MPLPVVCPACLHQFNVPEAYAGKRGKCPACAAVFRAPTAEDALAASQAAQALANEEAAAADYEDIPVGRAIDVSEGYSAPENPASPAPPFILESAPASRHGSPLAPKRPAPVAAAVNPLLIGGVAGGGVLLVAVVALAVWASSGGLNTSKSVAAGKKPAKKPVPAEVDPEDAPPKSASTTPAAKPAKSPDKPADSAKPAKPAEQPEELGGVPEFTGPKQPETPAETPSPPLPVADSLSVESIQKLAEECQKMEWKPADETQFKRLQVLARLLTQAKSAAENPANPVEERAKLGAAAQAVLEILSKTPWIFDAQLADLNRLSAASLKGEELGVFAFGTIMGATNVTGEADRKLLIVELGGTMDSLAVPVKTPVEETPPGSRWLILGYRTPGLVVNISIQGNGANRTIQPPVVTATHLIGEPLKN